MSVDQYSIKYGDWVICRNKIMYVCDLNGEDPSPIGLISKEDMESFDKLTYVSANEIEILPKRDIDENTLRSFFRLDVTPWQLCEQGCYPISDIKSFILTDDDLQTLSNNIHCVDIVTMDEWISHFIDFTPLNNNKEDIGLTLQITFMIFQKNLLLFNAEEDHRQQLTDIIDVYLSNKGKPFKELKVSSTLKKQIIVGMEAQSKTDITEDEKEGYALFLEELYSREDLDAIRHRAYAYYKNNKLVKKDWKKAEEALLKLIDYGEEEAAVFLGNIYYHQETPNYDKAFQYFTMAAGHGNIEAKYKMSDMYRRGLGVEKNPRKAFLILRLLYDQQYRLVQQGQYECDYPEVALRIGLCYEKGTGCPRDPLKAYTYFKAAEKALYKRRIHRPRPGDTALENSIQRSIERHNKNYPL